MKHIKITFSLFIFLCSMAFHLQAQDKAEVAFSFTNLNEKYVGKKMIIGVWFNEPEKFLDEGTAEIIEHITVSSVEQVYRLMLPKGKSYAFSCFIDDDGNGDLNTNFFGIPKEPYCFSNNFRPTLSAPNFEDCAFMLDGNQTMDLKLL